MSRLFFPKVDNVSLANCPVETSDGAKIKLGQLWQKKPVIFVFLRHFACIACRAHAKQVWQRREEYEKIGSLVFIANGEAEYIEHFRENLGLEGALILTDPSLQSFRAAGFHHGFRYIVQIPTLVNVWKMTKQGHKQVSYTKKAGTHWQLGGLLVVNMAGQVTYQYVSESLGDFPEEPHFKTIVTDEKNKKEA